MFITIEAIPYNPHMDEYGAMIIVVAAMVSLIHWYFTDELPKTRQEKAWSTYTGNVFFDYETDHDLAEAVEAVFAVDNQVYNVDEDGGI